MGPAMFTAHERDLLRAALLARAAADGRISGAAITGSAAEGREDVWSDIDLAFGVVDEAELRHVMAEWTALMYAAHGALHHMDFVAGQWIYRVFFLANTLQVDLAFVPATEFRAMAPSFRLVSGTAGEAGSFPAVAAGDLVGWGWLYALHARSSIARGKFWQAEFMISGMRDNALALACIRHGLTASHAKGVDLLPVEVLAPFAHSLVRELEGRELKRAFRVVIEAWVMELGFVDVELAERMGGAVRALG